ncbi:MAG: NUDIX domain-containing protein [bacterium]|nr:NUDIX domain-containing protein [candidate division KSB1 bacterium]MDH7558735.1 NUDIX domain-containing protein [bacterium]
MRYRFCPACGETLRRRELEGRERLVCSECGFVHYENPVPAVGVVVVDDGQFLLVKRKYPPRQGMWSLPAGFMEVDETPTETAVREAREETGLDVRVGPLLGVYAGDDDPRVRVVLIVYGAEIVGGKLVAGDDAEDARFFPVSKPLPEMAFASHCRVLQEAARQVKQGKSR